MAANWMEMLSNPKGIVIRNYMLQLLGDQRFLKHQAFIERLAAILPTTADIKELGEIMLAVYESGYFKALGDYQKEFEKLGYNVNVVRPENGPDRR